MPIPREEIETTVNVGYYDEELTFSTTDPKWARFMHGLSDKGARLERVHKQDGEEVAWTFKCPSSWFKLPKPKKRVSDEQRAAAAERMRKARGGDESNDDDD